VDTRLAVGGLKLQHCGLFGYVVDYLCWMLAREVCLILVLTGDDVLCLVFGILVLSKFQQSVR
jgi:hypothetical protein